MWMLICDREKKLYLYTAYKCTILFLSNICICFQMVVNCFFGPCCIFKYVFFLKVFFFPDQIFISNELLIFIITESKINKCYRVRILLMARCT